MFFFSFSYFFLSFFLFPFSFFLFLFETLSGSKVRNPCAPPRMAAFGAFNVDAIPDLQAQTRELRNEIQHLQTQIPPLEAQIRELRNEIQPLQAQIQRLQTQCLEFESELKSATDEKQKEFLRTQITEKERQISKFMDQITEKERQITEKERQISAMRREILNSTSSAKRGPPGSLRELPSKRNSSSS